MKQAARCEEPRALGPAPGGLLNLAVPLPRRKTPSLCGADKLLRDESVLLRGERLESLFASQQNGMRNYLQALKYEHYFSLSLLPGAQVMSECMHSTSMACFQALLQSG